jgi:hypothetical protein
VFSTNSARNITYPESFILNMYFQIIEIILWSKNPSHEPRRLRFEPGVVNVISGVSRTGKSAIIPIIDYCLGADKCTIPVNTIRDACGWFGVLVETIQGQKLFARREPELQKTTGDMFVLEGQKIEIPRQIVSKNTSSESVKRMLDELAGLTALDFDFENTGTGFKGRPSFRDLSAFIFQPQNIVANPNVLFYKADTHEHREKLRTIFPYILDAITPELLARQHELNQLRKTLRKKESELANVKQVSERWLAEIRSKVIEARELGLVESLPSQDAKREQLVNTLRNIVSATTYKIHVSNETISDAIQELTALNNEEREVSLELSVLRKRQAEMSALKESAVLYRGALQIQRDRLKISEWIGQSQNQEHDCPVCGNELDSSKELVTSLQHSLQEIEREAGEFDSVPASFDREFERVRADSELVADRLKAIRFRIRALEKSSEEAKQRQYDSLKVSRFVGNIEQALQTYAQIGTDSELSNEVEELKDRIRAIEKVLSEGFIKDRQRRALQAVNLNAGRLLPNLDVERPNDPIELSVTDLTIKVNGTLREDYLWEIGSGSNWLSYHLAITLGLHQFFLDLQSTPVPTFIIYDQPSQVYFPKRLPENIGVVDDPDFRDEDIEALHKVFTVFSEIVTRNNGNLQIIVLDHASVDLWTDLKNVHLAEEWRGGNKLVPDNWIEVL